MLQGFILTNCKALARVLKVDRGRVEMLLQRYIDSCSNFITWHLLDTSIVNCENPNDWHNYVLFINSCRKEIGLDELDVYNIPLFIIGGDDVVPMPEIKFFGVNYPADILYCYEPGCEDDLVQLVTHKPNFAVGRLPITYVDSENEGISITHLSNYLETSVSMINKTIFSRGSIMTTSESWYDMAQYILSDMSAVPLSAAYVPIHNNMITCPLLDTTIPRMYDGYVHELRKADFWLFCLHGSDNKEMSSFAGDTITSGEYPTAMQTSILEQTHPIILNTMACFGARYLGYQISESMLLSAFVNGTMLFCGANESAFYATQKPGYAAVLLKLYNVYLHKGYPAAIALLKAKQDYYVNCHEVDGDDLAMITLIEFNLYGCPILSMNPQLAMTYLPEGINNASITKSRISYNPPKVKPILENGMKCDINKFIKQSNNKQLVFAYENMQLELNNYFHTCNYELEQAYSLSDENNISFRFIYKSTIGSIKQIFIFECDKQGNILNVIGNY